MTNTKMPKKVETACIKNNKQEALKLENGEKLEDLQCGGLSIIQNKDLYCFTSDSVILANFIKLKTSENAVEIGGGCGVVSILVSAKNKFKSIKIFEIQEKLQKLCKKNIILNDLSEQITLIKDDVKNFKKYFFEGAVDVVFSNPPYFEVDDLPCEESRKIARQEVKLNLKELIEVTSKMLKFGGRFYCTYPAERSAELLAKCYNHNLAVKKMFFTENGKGKVTLVVIEAVKGGKHKVKVLPNLTTNKQDGEFLEELKTRSMLN